MKVFEVIEDTTLIQLHVSKNMNKDNNEEIPVTKFRISLRTTNWKPWMLAIRLANVALPVTLRKPQESLRKPRSRCER